MCNREGIKYTKPAKVKDPKNVTARFIQLNKLLTELNCYAILIKHKPFIYPHADIDIIVDLKCYSKILDKLKTRISKLEKLKIHMFLGSAEIEIHNGVSWWDIPFVSSDWCFEQVVSPNGTPYKSFLSGCDRILILNPSADSFVLLLSRFFQDFEITKYDLAHIAIYGDLRGAMKMFIEFEFSHTFTRILLSHILRCVKNQKNLCNIPLQLFVLTNMEYTFKSRFLASPLQRLILFARNIIWYFVKAIRRINHIKLG
ncbi:MAG: hypothetical protein B6U76_00705 [Desulfurococcales archaeon ex4484_217_2]|nr:MAG: hypothetical protein B6U76_00705 [Desulfurococcales archaeon ex4484_217_2]